MTRRKLGDTWWAREFGRRVERTRQARGLTASDLAERAGWSRVGLSNVENGHQTPSLESASRLARALGVCLDYLTPPPE